MAQLGNTVVNGALRVVGDSYTSNLSSTLQNNMITGTGTAAQDKGSGVSPRYFPAKWTFNTGVTVTDGDMFTIKIPVAGHSYGEFISVNNGTNYYPVGYNTNTLLTTQFPVGAIITVVFKSDGVVNSIYPVAGGDARVNVSGGAFYVLDLYDSGNSNNAVTQTATTTSANYEVLFSATADNTTRTEGARKNSNLKFNPATGTLGTTEIFSDVYGSSLSITARLTTLNFATASSPGTGRTKMRVDLAPNSSTGLPPAESGKDSAGFLHTYHWDNGGAMSQLYIPNGDHLGRNGPQGLMLRGYDGSDSSWKDWIRVPFFYTAPTSGQVVVTDGTIGNIKSSGYTIAKSVPSNAVFTDTNNAVTQTATSTSANYEVLFSATADNTTRTEGARKNSNLTFNPNTGNLTVTTINGLKIWLTT